MALYHKLVRDHIPEIIEQSGKKGTFRILGEEEFTIELKKKLVEEVKEYKEAQNHHDAIEKLADVMEIIHALGKIHGISMEELEDVRSAKRAQRGGFEERLFLLEVMD